MGKAEEGRILLSGQVTVDKIETELESYFIRNERIQQDMSEILEFSSQSYYQNTRYHDLGELDYLLDYVRRYRFESNVIGQLIKIYNALRTGGDLIKYYRIDNTNYPPENEEQFSHLVQYKLGIYLQDLLQKTPSELREYLSTTKHSNNKPLKGYGFIPNKGKYDDFYERNLSPQSTNITNIMDDIFS